MAKTTLLLTCAGPRAYLMPLFERSPEYGRLIAVDSDADVPIASFCADFATTPPVAQRDAYISALATLVAHYRVDAIATAHDIDLALIARAPELSGVIRNGVRAEEVGNYLDKWLQYQWLRARGLPTPATTLASEAEQWPADQALVFKPRIGAGGQGIRFLSQPQALEYGNAAGVLQPQLDGHEYHLDILNDTRGRVISVIPKRKLRMRYGSTDLAETVADRALLDLGVAIGEATGHIGSIDVDVMQHAGRTLILEINPRLGGGLPFSCHCAPDYMDRFLRVMRGDEVTPSIGNYRSGCRAGRMFSLYPIS